MSYSVPHPDIAAFDQPGQRNVVRRLYERVSNLENITNLQTFSGGRKAPVPPSPKLAVTTNPTIKGHVVLRITNPEFLGHNKNPIAAPLRHWIQASPNPQFNAAVTDFGITSQTYIATSELGSGTFYFRIRPTFDGKTFGTPVSSGKVVIP